MKRTLRLVLEVTYLPHGVPTTELREMLEGIVSYAMNRGLVTGDTEAEVDTYNHRIETVLTTKIRVSAPLKRFFEVEIRNEDKGGVRPARLGSAKESWIQAPDDIRAGWCGFAGKIAAKLAKVDRELDALIGEYGPDLLLSTIVK